MFEAEPLPEAPRSGFASAWPAAFIAAPPGDCGGSPDMSGDTPVSALCGVAEESVSKDESSVCLFVDGEATLISISCSLTRAALSVGCEDLTFLTAAPPPDEPEAMLPLLSMLPMLPTLPSRIIFRVSVVVCPLFVFATCGAGKVRVLPLSLRGRVLPVLGVPGFASLSEVDGLDASLSGDSKRCFAFGEGDVERTPGGFSGVGSGVWCESSSSPSSEDMDIGESDA